MSLSLAQAAPAGVRPRLFSYWVGSPTEELDECRREVARALAEGRLTDPEEGLAVFVADALEERAWREGR